jgi:site-specific DNA-methyltransferase (adenine-specific)
MKALPARSVDCFICDLPYGQLNKGGIQTNKELQIKYKKQIATQNPGMLTGCKWDIKLDLAALWIEIKRLCKDDHTPVLMFCNTRFGFELYNSNPDWFRYDLVWNKERGVSFLLANKMPMKSHEMIYVFSKKGAYYKRIDSDDITRTITHSQYYKSVEGTKYSGNVYSTKDSKLTLSKGCPPGKRCVLSVIDLKKVGTMKHVHPTEKPLELYKWLLERYCPEKGTVLDPTAGSFNAVYAGAELGLHAIGIEKDIGFFNKAIKKTMENTKKKEIVKDTMESINPTNEIIM